MTNLLTHFETEKVLKFQGAEGDEVQISLDLGVTNIFVVISDQGIMLEGELLARWDDLMMIQDHPNNVFSSDTGKWERVKAYSSELDRAYSLYPTREAPTMLISGIPMHRIKDVTPWEDTRNKLKALGSAHGAVLDTSTGLGYTAIWAARTATSVVTIELDPVVLELCWINPWSQAMFTAENIDLRIGHSWDVIEEIEAGSFSRVIHDPPMFSLAGELYSQEYYKELYRVMKNGGTLFHYIGDPKSKTGHSTTVGVVKRLEAAGFQAVKRRPDAFGVVARKGK